MINSSAIMNKNVMMNGNVVMHVHTAQSASMRALGMQ